MNDKELNSGSQLNITYFSFLGEIENIDYRNKEFIIKYKFNSDSEFIPDIHYKLNEKSISEEQKSKFKLVIKEIEEVFMDDWFEDQNIPKSYVDERSFRFNEASRLVEYNIVREIGDALPSDFYKYLNLEYEIETLSIFNEKPNTINTKINTSFCITDDKGNTLSFFTGPLYINSKHILLEFLS